MEVRETSLVPPEAREVRGELDLRRTTSARSWNWSPGWPTSPYVPTVMIRDFRGSYPARETGRSGESSPQGILAPFGGISVNLPIK